MKKNKSNFLFPLSVSKVRFLNFECWYDECGSLNLVDLEIRLLDSLCVLIFRIIFIKLIFFI